MTRPLLLVASAVGLALASLTALAEEIVIVVSLDGSTSVTVKDGFVLVYNCVGVRVDLNAPGLSTIITFTPGRREATCSDPTPPGPQSREAAAAEEVMGLTLLVAAILPGIGEPAEGAPPIFPEVQLGENPSQVQNLGEPAGDGVSPNFLQ